MEIWDVGYYGHLYNINCRSQRMTELQWPTSMWKVDEAIDYPLTYMIHTRKIFYPSISIRSRQGYADCNRCVCVFSGAA